MRDYLDKRKYYGYLQSLTVPNINEFESDLAS